MIKDGSPHDLVSDDADVKFVTRGDGCPTGLGEEQQIVWALGISHPFQHDLIVPDDDLRDALVFEISNSPEAIDRFRQAKLDWLFSRAEDLEAARLEWVKNCPDDIRQTVSRINGKG